MGKWSNVCIKILNIDECWGYSINSSMVPVYLCWYWPITILIKKRQHISVAHQLIGWVVHGYHWCLEMATNNCLVVKPSFPFEGLLLSTAMFSFRECNCQGHGMVKCIIICTVSDNVVGMISLSTKMAAYRVDNHTPWWWKNWELPQTSTISCLDFAIPSLPSSWVLLIDLATLENEICRIMPYHFPSPKLFLLLVIVHCCWLCPNSQHTERTRTKSTRRRDTKREHPLPVAAANNEQYQPTSQPAGQPTNNQTPKKQKPTNKPTHPPTNRPTNNPTTQPPNNNI